MRFRQFLLEYGAFSYGGVRPSGYFNIPQLMSSTLMAGRIPVAGFQSLTHAVDTLIDRLRYGDEMERGLAETYVKARTVDKLTNLAENVMAMIDNQHSSMTGPDPNKRYRHASYQRGMDAILGLPREALIQQGGFPELRAEDLKIGLDLGILFEDHHTSSALGGAFYGININQLRQHALAIRSELQEPERGFQAMRHLAQTGERLGSKIFGLMGQSAGGPQLTKGVNPLSGV